ncbi:hypothetical protein NDU88_003383 [Pleurodeles waltl]|uniref:Breast cancer metastasis-suppressor 1-like protein n=1 Tax=Pleurodeles waltl TaxID=8319 RepID=A0AAV7MZZ9_PLEWA|nr:hypothetical protein NDU88_003383 [Pleurodeles waltl]
MDSEQSHYDFLFHSWHQPTVISMPVGPERKESEDMEAGGDSAAEMNGEEDESEDEHTGSQSDSEEESSEMDDEDCERRRTECLDEMSDLEKQFAELKDKLFKERLQQVKAKLEEVTAGKAAEYIDPLAVLQKNMKIRIEVAGIYRGLCLEVIKNRHDCELQGAKQHLESEKLLLYDNMQSQLLERIQRLEEDRQSIDITSEWWDDELRTKRNRKKWDPFKPEKKKKPPLISDILCRVIFAFVMRDPSGHSRWGTYGGGLSIVVG